MITDVLSHNREQAGFLESDRIKTLDLPQDGSLLTITRFIESAMKSKNSKDVRPSHRLETGDKANQYPIRCRHRVASLKSFLREVDNVRTLGITAD